MNKNNIFTTPVGRLFTRVMILMLLTALPASFLSGAFFLSVFADETPDVTEGGFPEGFDYGFSEGSGEEDGGEFPAGSEDGFPEGFDYGFSEGSGGENVDEFSIGSGDEDISEFSAGSEEDVSDEAAYGSAMDAAEGSGERTSTTEEDTNVSVDAVAQLADRLISAQSSGLGVRSGGFTWDTEGKKRSWTYYNGIMMDAFLMLDTNNYFEPVNDFYDANIYSDSSGKVRVDSTGAADNYYRENELDSIPPARALFDLLRIDDEMLDEGMLDSFNQNKKKYRNMIAYIYSVMQKFETIEEAGGNFKHKMGNANWETYQFALDGLYMAQPFFMEVANALDDGVLTMEDFAHSLNDLSSVNSDDISDDIYCAVADRMGWVADTLYDEETQLYSHGWDPGVGVNGQYWLRAAGWYAAALADIISMLPDEYDDAKEELIENEKNLFDGMMKYQDPGTGMWYNVINYGPELIAGSGNRLETSGSALMAYAMMKSYVEGYVDDKYGEAGLRAFNGIVMNELEESDGSYVLHDVYISSGVETEPEGYCRNQYKDNEAKGVGPLIMASTYAREAARIHNYPVGSEISRTEDRILLVNEVPDFSNVELILHFENGTDRLIKYDELVFVEGEGYDPAVPGTYAVTVCYDGREYETINVIFKLPPPEFKCHSLVLSGQTGVNFYVELPGELADYEGSYMTFECNGLDADPVPPDPEFRNAKGYYGFTCYVNTLQMAEKITAVFHYGEGNAETVEDTYSVREYARKVDHLYNTLGPGNPDGIPDQVFYLVRSLNDYGYYAQQYLSRIHGFSLGVDPEEYSGGEEGDYIGIFGPYDVLSESASDLENTADARNQYRYSMEPCECFEDLAGLSYSLVLDSETTINIYYRMKEEPEDYPGYNVSSDGVDVDNVESQKLPGGRYLISIKNIPVHELGKQYNVTICGPSGDLVKLHLSALSYPYDVLKNESFELDMKYAMFSLFKYYDNVCAYREQAGN